MPSSPFLDALFALKNIDKELEYVMERTTQESPALVFKRIEEVKASVDRDHDKLEHYKLIAKFLVFYGAVTLAVIALV